MEPGNPYEPNTTHVLYVRRSKHNQPHQRTNKFYQVSLKMQRVAPRPHRFARNISLWSKHTTKVIIIITLVPCLVWPYDSKHNIVHMITWKSTSDSRSTIRHINKPTYKLQVDMKTYAFSTTTAPVQVNTHPYVSSLHVKDITHYRAYFRGHNHHRPSLLACQIRGYLVTHKHNERLRTTKTKHTTDEAIIIPTECIH